MLLLFSSLFQSLVTVSGFKLVIIHYHTQKERKERFEPRIKLNHNIHAKFKCFITQSTLNNKFVYLLGFLVRSSV